MRKSAFVTTALTEKKIEQILELGINEISLGWHNYNAELVNQLHNAAVNVSAEISLFVGKELWEKYPDARPIDRDGKAMEPIHWYHGVCPNHPDVREEKLSIIDNIIKEFDIDGLWLDFIRYPCHWEEVRTADITEYCFCKHCQEKYAAEIGGLMEGEKWKKWKCAQITNFVKEVCDRIEASGKPIELGLFAVPWMPTDFNGAIQHIIGQDFTSLSAFIDVFGAMAYHKITGNPVHWIHEILQSIAQQTGKSVLPLVQSIPLPDPVSPEEFSTSLETGLQSPSEGVMVFHFEDMLEDAQKTNFFKQSFTPNK